MCVGGLAKPGERRALRRLGKRLDERGKERAFEIVSGERLDRCGDELGRQLVEFNSQDIDARSDVNQGDFRTLARCDADGRVKRNRIPDDLATLGIDTFGFQEGVGRIRANHFEALGRLELRSEAQIVQHRTEEEEFVVVAPSLCLGDQRAEHEGSDHVGLNHCRGYSESQIHGLQGYLTVRERDTSDLSRQTRCPIHASSVGCVDGVAMLRDILYGTALNHFMQDRTKRRQAGRPREFDEGEALGKMQRQLWTTGLSGVSLDGIARSAGLNRPSLAAAFGNKDEIYAQAAARYVALMDERLSKAIDAKDLDLALKNAFEAAIDIYTDDGPDGCFVICTAPAEALTNPVCRSILEQALQAIDALFLDRLKKEKLRTRVSRADLSVLAEMLGATLHTLALRARAGWSRQRLLNLSAGAVDQVLAALTSSQGSRKRQRQRSA